MRPSCREEAEIAGWKRWRNQRRVALVTTLVMALMTALSATLLGTGPAHAGNPLAPPGAKLQGAPPVGIVGRPITVLPGEPQQLKWTKVKPSVGPGKPGLTLSLGRVVASANERLVALSPDGDAAVLRDQAGRVRVVQLLSGRVSPFLKLPKEVELSLAVSGFATVGWEAKTRTFHRVQSWVGRDQGHYPVPGKDAPAAVVVAPDARHAAVVSTPNADGEETAWKLCVQLIPLGVEGPERRTCWSGKTSGDDVTLRGVSAVFTDDGEHVWVAATSSWSVGCGGGGEEVHVARVDVATGAVTGRFDSETHKPGGTGEVGDAEVNQAVAVAGMDAMAAWQDGADTAPRGDAVFWRFEWTDGGLVATTTARGGPARPVRGGRSWVAVERGLVVVRAAGGGFVEDVAALPVGLVGQKGAEVTVADDGRHVAVTTGAGVLLWDVTRARAVAWFAAGREVKLARSRALWRAADGALRTATWVQLEGMLPGLGGGFGAVDPGLGAASARLAAAVLMVVRAK